MSTAENDTGGDPPCFADTLVNGQPVDPQTRKDVARFRRAERTRLLALRRAVSQNNLVHQAEQVARGLNATVTPNAGMTIAGYWPIRGELDLRKWMAAAHEAGARVVLPVVIEKDAPVAFHLWSPDCKMTRGVWNIPVPADGIAVVPDVVISPLLGVDEGEFRLGNGGGYYDRTLAVATPKPLVIGVGHDFCRMKTIFPMPWDIPMDQVILGDGTTSVR